MDSEKLKKMQDASWQPAASCGSCIYGEFQTTVLWGVCDLPKNNYIHGKHNREHKLPAHKNAVCKWFTAGSKFFEVEQFLKSPVTS